jgi:molybdopterin-guanine dinucleotide biosynthesis protein A
MVQALRCRFVDIHSLEEIDPGLRSFTNINKLEDLGRLS